MNSQIGKRLTKSSIDRRLIKASARRKRKSGCNHDSSDSNIGTIPNTQTHPNYDNMTMSDLCREMPFGQISEREKELQKIDSAAANRKQTSLICTATSARETPRVTSSRTGCGLITKIVNNSIVLVDDSGIEHVDRHAEADADADILEEVEEDDLTHFFNRGTWLHQRRRKFGDAETSLTLNTIHPTHNSTPIAAQTNPSSISCPMPLTSELIDSSILSLNNGTLSTNPPSQTSSLSPAQPKAYSSQNLSNSIISRRNDRWTREQTDAFYEALSLSGTDFHILSALIPGRTRRQVKAKFLREERLDSERVRAACFGKSTSSFTALESIIAPNALIDPATLTAELERIRNAATDESDISSHV